MALRYRASGRRGGLRGGRPLAGASHSGIRQRRFGVRAAGARDARRHPREHGLGRLPARNLWRRALTLLVAIFASNLPEALGGAVGMRLQGRPKGFTIGVWSATAILLAAAVVVADAALAGVGEQTLAILLSFAGGAVLASLADTLMPDAYREGGPLVAFATAAGFLLSFLIAEM
jgi:hypothetical protein